MLCGMQGLCQHKVCVICALNPIQADDRKNICPVRTNDAPFVTRVPPQPIFDALFAPKAA